MSQGRVQPGVPTGGQFATSARTEPAIDLAPASRPGVADSVALDRIALMLGSQQEWSGSADSLEDAANLIASTGRPHPGEGWAPGQYAPRLSAWRNQDARPTQRERDAATLDRVAVHLAEASDWSTDDLMVITEQLDTTGRPHVGDRREGEYATLLRRWQISEGLVKATTSDRISMTCDEAGLPVMTPVLETLRDRGDVSDDVLMAMSPEHVQDQYERHVAPVIDQANAFLESACSGDTVPNSSWSDPEAIERIEDVCVTENSSPITEQMLLVAHGRGDLTSRALWGLDADSDAQMYDELVGPAIDDLERELASWKVSDL